MSYVGKKYAYDLFVSYSHGVSTADATGYDAALRVRDWTQKVVRDVADGLRLGLSDAGGFDHYLDDRAMDSGEDLQEEVEEAARSSALILIFMSPAYRNSPWCRDELRWFFDQAKKDGRGREHSVLRVIVPTSHKPDEEKAWPAELLDRAGQPVNMGERFYNPDTNNPIELLLGQSDKPFAQLAGPIESLVAEIKKKLERFKTQLEISSSATPLGQDTPHLSIETEVPAIAEPEVAQPAAEMRPQLYLQRHGDTAAWQWLRDELGTIAFVRPNAMEPEAPTLSLLSTYNERRRRALINCQGLVLLRWMPDDPSEAQVSSAYDDRRTLRSDAGLNVPWVLVDGVDDGGPSVPEMYNLPRVSTGDADWPLKVLKILGTK